MADGSKHIIKKQVLDLELLVQSNNGHQIQSEISEVYKAKVIPVLEAVLDNLAEEGESVKVEKLELDLGEILLHKLDDEFPEKVEQQLRKTLGEQLVRKRNNKNYQNNDTGVQTTFSPKDEENISIKSLPESKIEWLVHFLRTGQMPWNAGVSKNKKSFPELLKELVKEAPVTLWQVLSAELQQLQQRKRFIYQCTDGLIFDVLQQWSRNETTAKQAKEIISLYNDLNNVLLWKTSIFKRLNKASIRQVIWEEAILTIDSVSGQSSFSDAKLIIRLLQVFEILIRKESGEDQVKRQSALKFAKQISTAVSQLSKTNKLLKDNKLGILTKEIIKGVEGAEIINAPSTGATETTTETASGTTGQSDQRTEEAAGVTEKEATEFNKEVDRKRKQKSTRKENQSEGKQQASTTTGKVEEGEEEENLTERIEKARQRFEAGQDADERLKEQSGVTQAGEEAPKAYGQAESGKTAKSSQKSKDSKRLTIPIQQDVEEAYITNAGLVLLHPFLPLFFEGLGLLKGETFNDDTARERAAHLLQYLATGQQETQEEELFLNKLICGIEPAEPVISGIEITGEEKEECENLLKHVIELWEALKTSSVESVRQAFLNREGLIVKNEAGGWKVMVERNTFDVLLDRLPWGISIIKFPWNNYLIYVEW